MRDIGYSLETALADVIDNSISAGATRIDILASTSGDDPNLAVLDNGRGMSREDLLIAMRPGSRNPHEERMSSDLGRFGLGLKTASFSQCRRLTVLTRHNGIAACAIWDLDHVARTNRWEVLLPSSVEELPHFDKLSGDGTLVTWEKLDRISQTRAGVPHQSIAVLVDEAREHLELVFHRYLEGERSRPRIAMLLNGRALEPFDPFNAEHSATQRHPLVPEILRLKGHEVTVQAFTLPHHRKVSSADWERYAGKAGYTKNQGFYVYRERRLIMYGTWFGLARQTEATKLARVRIDTPRELDADWKIDVKKASAQPPAELRDLLRRFVEQIGATSRRVYTHRGQMLASDNRLPVWKREQRAGEIRYKLNEEHPAFADLITRLDKRTASRFRGALELAAAALPMDALIADLSGRPEEVEGEAMSDEAMIETALTMYRTLAGTDRKNEPTLAMIAIAEPFRARWPEISAALAHELGWED
jgi:hypothetical protein